MENEKIVPTKVEPIVKKEKVAIGEYTMDIIRDFDGKVDPFYLSEKDPNYSYRFLKDDAQSGGKNISMKTGNLLLQKGGWMLCPKEHLAKLGIKERELSPDGFLRRGDTILAFMPKSLFDQKVDYKNKLAKEPVNAIKRMVAKGDENVGKGIHNTMKGIQTKKALGM